MGGLKDVCGKRRLAGLVIVLALAAATFAADVKAGLANPLSCQTRMLSTPFASFGDSASYFLLSNGGFESGSTNWTLTGKAKVGTGNESYYAAAKTDKYSLSLPTGSSATSRALCVDGSELYMRFFARNTGSVTSMLKVDVLWENTSGAVQTTTMGYVTGSGNGWMPSSQIYFGLSSSLFTGGTANVAFRFTPTGTGGAWSIDDVFVDPFKNH